MLECAVMFTTDDRTDLRNSLDVPYPIFNFFFVPVPSNPMMGHVRCPPFSENPASSQNRTARAGCSVGGGTAERHSPADTTLSIMADLNLFWAAAYVAIYMLHTRHLRRLPGHSWNQ